MACRSCGWRACPFAGAASRTKNKIRRYVSCTYGTTWRKVRLPWLRLPPFPGPDHRFSSPGAAPVAAAAPSRRRNLPTPPSLSPYRRRRHMLCRRALPTAGALDKPYPPDEHTAFCVRHLLAFPPVLEQMPSVDQLCGPALYHRVPEGPGDSIQTRQARCRGSRSRLARASGAL